MLVYFHFYLGKLMIEEKSIEKKMKGPMLSLSLKGLLTALNLSIAMMTIQTIDRVIAMLFAGCVNSGMTVKNQVCFLIELSPMMMLSSTNIMMRKLSTTASTVRYGWKWPRRAWFLLDLIFFRTEMIF